MSNIMDHNQEQQADGAPARFLEFIAGIWVGVMLSCLAYKLTKNINQGTRECLTCLLVSPFVVAAPTLLLTNPDFVKTPKGFFIESLLTSAILIPFAIALSGKNEQPNNSVIPINASAASSNLTPRQHNGNSPL
jgi:putative effector of murein hydrolase